MLGLNPLGRVLEHYALLGMDDGVEALSLTMSHDTLQGLMLRPAADPESGDNPKNKGRLWATFCDFTELRGRKKPTV